MLSGALVLGAIVWAGVAGDAVGLGAAGWWAPFALLVVPGVMLGLWVRERRG